MVNLRDDIYPKMTDWYGQTREDILNVWIDEAYIPFTEKFKSRDDFILFLNAISNPKDAELFLRLCKFYAVSKTVVKDTFTKLIMIFSIIETIVMRGEKYQPFKQWIVKRSNSELIQSKIPEIQNSSPKSFRKIMEYFKNVYHNTYGSTRNVISFFDKYVDFEYKRKIIKSFRYKRFDVVYQFSKWFFEDWERKPEIYQVSTIRELENYRDDYSKKYMIEENDLMPNCYTWEYCYVDYGDCYPEYGCFLEKEPKTLQRHLNEIINVIYAMRSEFVHNAHYPSIGGAGMDVYGGVYNDASILVLMSIIDFERIFENGLLNYYRSISN